MKMRKLMAVVLAVVVAISAMAISAFATEYETYQIDMYNYDLLDTTYYTATYTLEIPAYALYGYATSGESFTLTLPGYLGADLDIGYSMTINGVTVGLKGVSAGAYTTYETFDQEVIVGTFARSYYSDAIPAMVPQSTAVSATTPIVITMTVTSTSYSAIYSAISSQPYQSYNCGGVYYAAPVITYTDANGEDNVLYGWSFADTTAAYTSSVSTGYIVIVANSASGNGSVVYTTSQTADNAECILTWDHTLANRATILNAVSTEGTTAKLVVVLGGAQSYYTPIYGTAVYTLHTYAEDVTWGSSSSATGYWYTSGTSALNVTNVSSCIVNGYADTLEFEVPVSVLYNSTYGVYNGYMTIQQTAVDTVTSSDYRYYNNTNWWSYYQLTATEVYLELSIPVEEDADDSDTIDVVDPIEPTDTETEEDGTDTTETETPDETTDSNPTTGIVLALVPMAVAAAAAVASKRR